jgi:lipopolysaccharide export system protein LptA
MPGEKIKRFSIAALAVVVLLLLLTFSGAVDGGEKDIFGISQRGEGKPTHITADRLEAYKEKEMATFSGNVVATQDDWVLKSDTLTFYFEKSESSDGDGSGKLEGDTEISRIEARGNVRITQGERIVTGEKAIFYREEQKTIVTGNPVLKEGENVIEGDRVIVFMEEKRGVVEGTKGKRVSATIYPDDKKEKKKKE